MHLGVQPQAPRIVIRDADSGAADGGMLEHLQSQYEAVSEDSFVCVGDVIPTDMQDGFLRCGTPSLAACELLCMRSTACATASLHAPTWDERLWRAGATAHRWWTGSSWPQCAGEWSA